MKMSRLIGIITFALSAPIPPALLAQSASTQEEKSPSKAVKIEETQVTAEREPAQERSYGVKNATSATKTNTPLLETPQAVSVVSRALIEDQGARKLEDVLKNVAGVTPGGYYSDWDYYRLRGFDAAFTTYWDGFKGDYGKNVELYGLDRVEVIKGPTASLYGQGPLGGLVNLISKRPRPETFADVQFTIGSFNFYEPAADVNVPLNASKSVYARLTALYRDQESFTNFVHKRRVFVAPALTWEIGPKTTLTFLTQHVHDWDRLGFPLPAQGTVLPNINGKIPIHRFIGERENTNEVEQWRARIGYELSHQFNQIFSLRHSLNASRMWQNWNRLLYPSSLDADERTLYRYPYGYREELDRFAMDTAVETRLATGPIQHYLIAGVDYYRNHSRTTARQIDYADFPGSYPAIDVFNPQYDARLPPFASKSKSASESTLVGLYLQEQAKFFNRLTLTVGGRVDFSSNNGESVNAFSPRVGLTYELLSGVALYANYSESFNPQWFSRNAAGKPVNPETGENFEVGLKTSLLDGRLNTLLAVYQLTRQNVATANLATADPFDSIVSGEQRSRGVEVEGALQLMPGWDLIITHTYNDAKITKDNTLPVGARLQGVPEYIFSAWTKYTLQQGPLKGLGFGLGGRYYTDQEGDATYTNRFKLPAFGILDAALYYVRGPFRAQVNINNALDERHFVGSYNNLYVLPGEPLNVRATVGWAF
jgi:iron complex outermembrane recepter protein